MEYGAISHITPFHKIFQLFPVDFLLKTIKSHTLIKTERHQIKPKQRSSSLIIIAIELKRFNAHIQYLKQNNIKFKVAYEYKSILFLYAN